MGSVNHGRAQSGGGRRASPTQLCLCSPSRNHPPPHPPHKLVCQACQSHRCLRLHNRSMVAAPSGQLHFGPLSGESLGVRFHPVRLICTRFKHRVIGKGTNANGDHSGAGAAASGASKDGITRAAGRGPAPADLFHKVILKAIVGPS